MTQKHIQNIVPISKILKEQIDSWKIQENEIASLIKLEQFILYGVLSFGTASIVLQGWAIDATIRRNWELYLSMVKELQGEKEFAKTAKRKEHYINVKPIILWKDSKTNDFTDEGINEFVDKINKQKSFIS